MSQARRAIFADRDLVATAAGAIVYSFALGITTVALPLLALDAGYGKAVIGYLIASSAIAQMATRLVLGIVMRRYPDWMLIFVAGGLLATSSVVVASSAALAPFIIAELVQGVARACFWTGSQTHVVRGEGSSVGRLAGVNLVSGIGLLGGPLAAGFLGNRSLSLAMYAAAVVAVIGMVPPLLLTRLPPFAAPTGGPRSAVWRRPGVDVGCMAGVTAGTWRGMLSTYVPVALEHAGKSASGIGGLISVANGASIAGTALIGRIGDGKPVRSFASGTIAAGLGTALVGAFATVTPVEVAILVVSGVGAGALQALGPAIATDSVEREERGSAIAITGTYRAAALFASPLGVGASLAVLPISVAVAIAGGLITLPALVSSRARAARRMPDGLDVAANPLSWPP